MLEDFDDKRWWPVTRTESPMRHDDIIYAALGPFATNQLVTEYKESLAKGVFHGERTKQFFDDLSQKNGRAPEMLYLLVAAAAALAKVAGHQDSEFVDPDQILDIPVLVTDAYKLFGWFAVEACRAFGFDKDSLIQHLTEDWQHYGDGGWPPRDSKFSDSPAGDNH